MNAMPMSFLRVGRALVATNLKASFAHRGAFWLQMSFMFLNNFLFFTMWWILFDRFEEIGGWRVNDMLALYGICALSFGLFVALAGGSRDLARVILDGDLDVYLTQPGSPLLKAVTARSYADGWGDAVSGVVMLALSGRVGWETIPLVMAGILCGTTVFLATAVLVHSLAFWAGSVNGVARQYTEFLIFFSIYPEPIFRGAIKVFLFTVVPAGFVGQLPMAQIQRFDPGALALLGGGTLGYVLAAAGTFRAGLRRYESGNRVANRGA